MSRLAPEVIDIVSSDNDNDASIDSEGEHLPTPVYGSPTPPPCAVTLSEAIASVSEQRAREILTKVCAAQKPACAFVTNLLLHPVPGPKSEKPQYKARFQICKHCRAEYQVASNNVMGCRYHPGRKEVDYDGDYWADNDDEVHGYPDELIQEDNSDYDEGAKWTCCDASGGAKGCVRSRHKPKIDPRDARRPLKPPTYFARNTIATVKPRPATLLKPVAGNAPKATPASVKRKYIEFANCIYCSSAYDVARNDPVACKAHSGQKEVDYTSDTWCDHSNACHGRPETLIRTDPATYDGGAMWSCCKAPGYDNACTRLHPHYTPPGARKTQRLML